jgi:hypothetical protein
MNEPRSTQNHMNAAPKDESAGAQAVAAAHSLPPPDASEADVLAAWLAAGARSDVAAMRGLRIQFPQWLDLQRVKSPLRPDRLSTVHAPLPSRAAMRVVQRPAGSGGAHVEDFIITRD